MPERNNEYVYQPPAEFTEELRQRINNAGFSDEFKQQIKSAQKEEGRKMFERLTHRDSKGDVWIKDAAHVDEQGQICMLSERLAQYEDIGLTPDEITDKIYRFEAFLCEMTGNRMSKSNYTLDAMISAANDYQQSLCDGCWDRSELAKYYELEHEKRLVVLPCKVGDTVYEITREDCDYEDCPDEYHDRVDEVYIDQITCEIFENEVEIKLNDYLDIKDAYPTYEAAEKALGGGQG